MAALQSRPHWVGAAQALVDGCIDLADDDERVAFLAAVCQGLGDELYPAFIRVLWTIGQHGDHPAKAAVARALVHALRTGRLPSGRRGAWGGSAPVPAGQAWGRARSLGPIEYLCAWHAQTDAVRAISSAQFHTAARALMDLVACSREARLLYCEKLMAEADDPIGGALARATREALRALALAWSQGASSSDASARFLAALQGRAGADALARMALAAP